MTWRALYSIEAALRSPYRGTVFHLPLFGLFTVDRSDVLNETVYDANGRSATWEEVVRAGEVISLPLHLVESEAERFIEARYKEIRALEIKVNALEAEVEILRTQQYDALREVATLKTEIATLRRSRG